MSNLDVHRALEIRAQIARDRDGKHVVVGGSDPSVERHRTELFGVPQAPDFTPADLRYTPPKKVLMEWVGEPSPYDSEVVRALKLRGLLTPIHRLVLDQVALNRFARADGFTVWTLGLRDGLSQTYRWGEMPGTFVREVAFADVDKILRIGAERSFIKGINQFRVLGKHSDALPYVLPDEAWVKAIRRLSRLEGLPDLPIGADKLRIRTAREQPLVGVNKAGTYGQWRV